MLYDAGMNAFTRETTDVAATWNMIVWSPQLRRNLCPASNVEEMVPHSCFFGVLPLVTPDLHFLFLAL